MNYNIEATNKYMRDVEKAKERGLVLADLFNAVELLATGQPLPSSMHDHNLKGKFKGCRECHINPDWLLIYNKNKKVKLITLIRTGTHSDLF